MNTKQLDACIHDMSSITWEEPMKNALEEVKEEVNNITETVAKLQAQKDEINADKTDMGQRLHQKGRERMECLVQSYRAEVSQLKGVLEQINQSLEQVVQEEKCQRQMSFADNEAIKDAEIAIDEFHEDMDKLGKELEHARKEEEKIANELKGLSLSLVSLQPIKYRYIDIEGALICH